MSAKDVPVSIAVPAHGIFLYYNQFSFYSQKVLMALYEKQLPFESQTIELIKNEQYESWFLDLNPKGEVPVIIIDGNVICDSSKILDYLEDRYCGTDVPQLIPMFEDPSVRQKVTYYRHILDQIPVGMLTVGSFFHPELVKEPKSPFVAPVVEHLKIAAKMRCEGLKKRLEDCDQNHQDKLFKQLVLLEKKFRIIYDKKAYENLLNYMEDVLDKIEDQLATHADDEENWWLCSRSFSVTDISLTLLLERLYQIGLEYRFWEMGKRPHLTRYYERAKQRPYFQKVISIPYNMIAKIMADAYRKPLIVAASTATGIGLVVGGVFLIKSLIQ